MSELIICEKPSAAKKLAEALGDKIVKKSEEGVPYYEIKRGKEDITIACAVGHLYGLTETSKNYDYPVFDIKWDESNKITKTADFSKKYLNVIKKLAKGKKVFTIACDYDVEGEVIGYNVIRFACKQKDARRMKFSTLTKPDLVEAYEHASPNLNWGHAIAGETRHIMDWYYGINMSRALTTALKSAGTYRTMSIGRVQGPALRMIVEKEREIKAFKSEPFWELLLKSIKDKINFEALHEKGKIWKEVEANTIFEKVKNAKEAIVIEIITKKYKQNPPNPFDLTSLQTEAYACFGITPKDTLAIAQELYTSSFISYPRTSSQELSPKLGFVKILTELSKQKNYKELCAKLLAKKTLVPNNGKKTDPAHPAIYPTGIFPESLNDRQRKLYDLIVKRFFATFGEAAVRESVKARLDVNSEIFVAEGHATIEKNWHELYHPYVKNLEVELPKLDKGDKVPILEINKLAKETKPPKRYTQSSIIKELEKRNLGTKSTRAAIVDTLYKRGYCTGKAVEATEFGIETISTLEKHCPKIIDEELTRHFEQEMEVITLNPKDETKVIEEAKNTLIEISKDFKKDEKEIGKELLKTVRQTEKKQVTLGVCPVCKVGDLIIIKSKKTKNRFIACNKYPDCKTTFSLPQSAKVTPALKECEKCHYPMIKVLRARSAPKDICINSKCETKQLSSAENKEVSSAEKEKIKCPGCNEGELLVRKSIYGTFYGCSKYPKCRFTKPLNNAQSAFGSGSGGGSNSSNTSSTVENNNHVKVNNNANTPMDKKIPAKTSASSISKEGASSVKSKVTSKKK